MAPILALYPGQGSQSPGMALDLHQASKQVKELFSLASEAAHTDLYALLSTAGEDDLKQTRNAQLAITLASRSAYLRLREANCTFKAHSGFSLGELAAYAGGGILDDFTLFSIIEKRAALMDEMSEKATKTQGELGMAAIIGLGFSQVNEAIHASKLKGVYPSNDNGPAQVVVAGLAASITFLKPVLMEMGAKRVIPLKVSGPFHTPFMEEATESFLAFLETQPFSDPKELVISSVDGSVITTKEDARGHLARQLACPVRWTAVLANVKKLSASNPLSIAEVGYGTVLTGLCKNSGLDLVCRSLGTESAIQEFAKEMIL